MTVRPVGWVGSLSEAPIAEVLRRVALEERSGDLQVIFGRTIKTVYFDHGFIVLAASNLKRDRLGESMIELGRISRQEFAVATMLMKNSPRRKFGQALVQAGVMSEEELGRQVALQVNRIVLSLFRVTDGIYSFDERPCIIPVSLMVSLSIYRILLDGIRRMTDDKLILKGLPPVKTRLRVSETPPFTVNVNKLKPAERDVLRAAAKGKTLSSILREVHHEHGAALRACYGLMAAGLLVKDGVGSVDGPLKVQEETGAFLLSEIQQKFARIQATNTRQEILMEYDRLDRVAGPDLLKVEESAALEEIERAFERQRTDWARKRDLVLSESSMVTKVDEIQTRLERAREQLLSERREPATVGPSPEESDTLPPLGPDSTELKFTESLPTEVEAPMPPLDEELIEEVTIEMNGVLPLSEEISTSDTMPAMRAAAESPGTSETIAPAESLRPLNAVQKLGRIRQLHRDVKLHFQFRDWEGAVSLLYELVSLAPSNAYYHALLAKAIARHPVLRKDAERHFIEALRLDPQSLDLHYSLGLYYKSFGMQSRAETEFRTVLRLNPAHEGARKHLLGERKRRDPLRDMFRRIFG